MKLHSKGGVHNLLISKYAEVMCMKEKTKAKFLESVGCKCYRPGDPGFEALACKVIPLHKIRSAFKGKLPLDLDDKPICIWKRNESTNALYAS